MTVLTGPKASTSCTAAAAGHWPPGGKPAEGTRRGRIGAHHREAVGITADAGGHVGQFFNERSTSSALRDAGQRPHRDDPRRRCRRHDPWQALLGGGDDVVDQIRRDQRAAESRVTSVRPWRSSPRRVVTYSAIREYPGWRRAKDRAVQGVGLTVEPHLPPRRGVFRCATVRRGRRSGEGDEVLAVEVIEQAPRAARTPTAATPSGSKSGLDDVVAPSARSGRRAERGLNAMLGTPARNAGAASRACPRREVEGVGLHATPERV